jgi:hypothetical protein
MSILDSQRSATHIEPEDAEEEDAAEALAVVLAHAVQVGALPGRVARKGVAGGAARDALRAQPCRRALVGRQEGCHLRADACTARSAGSIRCVCSASASACWVCVLASLVTWSCSATQSRSREPSMRAFGR